MPSPRGCRRSGDRRLLAASSGNATVVTVDRRQASRLRPIGQSSSRAAAQPPRTTGQMSPGMSARTGCVKATSDSTTARIPRHCPLASALPGKASSKPESIGCLTHRYGRGDQLMMDLDGHQSVPVTTEINARPDCDRQAKERQRRAQRTPDLPLRGGRTRRVSRGIGTNGPAKSAPAPYRSAKPSRRGNAAWRRDVTFTLALRQALATCASHRVRLGGCGMNRSCLRAESARAAVREVPIFSAFARASVSCVSQGQKEELS